MTGKPMTEHSNGALFLSPLSQSQGQASRLLPSPMPPQTASSASSQRPTSGFSAASSTHDRARDDHADGPAVRKSHSHSLSSNPHTLASSSNSADAHTTPRHVRTLPPWVQATDDDDVPADPTAALLPRTPVSARPPSHNHMPTPKGSVPGRKFDYMRESEAVTLKSPLSENASKWQRFAKASELPDVRPPSSRGQIVDEEWMKENMPNLEEPWQPMDQEEKEELRGFWLFNSRKRAQFHRALMNHPMVPLAVRMIVLTFSVLALALAGSIFHRSPRIGCINSSTYLAVIVDVVAIVYTCYITYDEYTSKPLGLRSHNAKMRLIFLDLAFIVFDSANLSLAFQALTDERWVCRDNNGGADLTTCPFSPDICTRQKALTATLLVVLLAWIGTFTISTLRLIERVAR